MISTIITLIIGAIVFIVLSIIFRKSNSLKLKNKSIPLSLVISIILTVILSFVPFENAFMSFSSPQKAFSYSYDSEIKAILDGENSTMIIADDNNTDQIDIIPKTKEKDKWKIGMGYNIKSVANLKGNGFYVFIDTYDKSKDYYIYITTMNMENCEITDNCNSEFQLIPDKPNSYYKNYAAYIKNFNKNYSIFINNEEIKLSELTPIMENTELS